METTDPRRACVRCDHDCPHVEGAGLYYCPNCGPPIECDGPPGFVTYAFGLGCEACGIAGASSLRARSSR